MTGARIIGLVAGLAVWGGIASGAIAEMPFPIGPADMRDGQAAGPRDGQAAGPRDGQAAGPRDGQAVGAAPAPSTPFGVTPAMAQPFGPAARGWPIQPAASTTWSPVPSDNAWGTTTSQTSGIACPAANACTAVGGRFNAGGQFIPLAMRWDGLQWQVQATPRVPGDVLAGFNAVSCPTTSECTAVGTGTDAAQVAQTVAEHFSAGRWSLQATPNPSGATVSVLAGVSCPSASVCLAVGEAGRSATTQHTLSERWNGTSWQLVPTPALAPGALTAVSCTSASACTAVGGYTRLSGTVLALAERWDGTRWILQTTPRPTGSAAETLRGVSCPSATRCVAVGLKADPSGNVTTLTERWDGKSWSIVESPNPDPSTTLRPELDSVSCVSASACMATGHAAILLGNLVPLTERWDGTRWRLETAPNPATASDANLPAVACSSATTCRAAGRYDSGDSSSLVLLEGWNGSSWSITPAAEPPGELASLLDGISCTAASACTAVGIEQPTRRTYRGLAERWNRSRFSEQAVSPTGARLSSLLGVSCSTATACMAVGAELPPSSSTQPLTEQWNGTSWATHPAPLPSGSEGHLRGVTCSGPSSCTAVGGYLESSGSTGGTLAEHWNGTVWTSEPTPPPSAQTPSLAGVACPASSDCVAVGHGFSPSTSGLVLVAEHWNGTSWATQAVPAPAGSTSNTFDGVACPAAGSCYAVGTTSNGNRDLFLVEHWNGGSWSIMTTSSPVPSGLNHLHGVSCSSTSACTAVGDANDGNGGSFSAFALRFNGVTWSLESTPSLTGVTETEGLAVSCPGTCLAVGLANTWSNATATLAERRQ